MSNMNSGSGIRVGKNIIVREEIHNIVTNRFIPIKPTYPVETDSILESDSDSSSDFPTTRPAELNELSPTLQSSQINRSTDITDLEAQPAKSDRAKKQRCLTYGFVFTTGILIVIIICLSSTQNLQSQNSDLTNELERYKNLIDKEKLETTEINNSDCGGIIRIPPNKKSYLLQYKLNANYAPNENCLWIMENTEGSEDSIRSQLTLRVELISKGFKENTKLFVFKWNQGANLTSKEITSGEEHELSAEGLYFSFTSDSETSTGGTGFLLQIIATHSQRNGIGSNLFFPNSDGSRFVFSNYDSDQISVAINTKVSITFRLKIHNGYLKENTDLVIYEIHERGTFEERRGLNDKSSILTFHTANPILSIFTSDKGDSQQRFKISWNKTENKID